MIVTAIRIQSNYSIGSLGTPYIDFELTSNAGANGYILRGIDGFGPSKSNPVNEGFDNFGEPIKYLKPENKELSLKVGFLPGPAGTVSSLRDKLYGIISRTVRVSLINGSAVIGYITGNIYESEPTHMSSDPTLQFVVSCDQGLFVAPDSVVVNTVGLGAIPTFDYIEGTAATGAFMRFQVVSGVPAFGMYGKLDTLNIRQWYLFINYTFLTGDELTIYTARDERKAIRNRGGILLDVTGYLQGGSIFPQLHPGENTFNINPAFNLIEMNYFPRFWGI